MFSNLVSKHSPYPVKVIMEAIGRYTLGPRHDALPRPTFPHDGPGRKPSAAGIRPTSRFAPTTHHPEIGQKIIYMQWKQVLAEASVGITIAILEGAGSEEERA